ncbi:MAG: hypothetical protein JXN63_04680 [Candidatus Delongbacteria bacterium]|nr:hypothetical protein [Candidatus Delongbacteria bacterium]
MNGETERRNRSLMETSDEFKAGEEVEILICNRSDLGLNVIVNDKCWGLIHNTDILGKLKEGERTKGFVKTLRDDNKIDISLQRPGYKKVTELTDVILEKIKENGGTLYLTDKSHSDDIFAVFKVSKKTFKQAIGALYKQRIIVIEKDSIRLKAD